MNLDFDISEEPPNDFTADFETKGRAQVSLPSGTILSLLSLNPPRPVGKTTEHRGDNYFRCGFVQT
jgi:hypothetical protein